MAIGHRITAPYSGHFDPTRFVTSWALPPSLLFGYRLLLALYAFTTLFTIFGWNATHGRPEESRHSFSFFTVLTYWGLAFYYAFSAVHTASYWLTGTSFLSRWPKPLQVAHSMFYSTIVVYPWIVTIVFWTLLAADFPTTFSIWSNTSQHALNSFYAFCEILFPSTTRLPWLDLVPIVLLLSCYLGLAYLTHATEGFYVYPFLNLQKNSSGVVAGYIMGILAAAIIFFIIARYLIALRLWVTETKLGMRGKVSPRATTRAADGDIPLYNTAK